MSDLTVSGILTKFSYAETVQIQILALQKLSDYFRTQTLASY